MTMKLIGSVCIFIGCTMVGIKASLHLTEHVRFLYGFIEALETIESEISCKLSSIPVALRSACATAIYTNGKCGTFFVKCIARIDERGVQDFASVWRETVDLELSFLTEVERQVISGLAEVLGSYGAEEQQKAIAYTRRRLEMFLQTAEKEKERSGKVYITLGLTLGIGAVIVLI